MSHRTDTTFHLTAEEVVLLVALVANNLDPKDFKHYEARALIFRCKAQTENPAGWLRVGP